MNDDKDTSGAPFVGERVRVLACQCGTRGCKWSLPILLKLPLLLRWGGESGRRTDDGTTGERLGLRHVLENAVEGAAGGRERQSAELMRL